MQEGRADRRAANCSVYILCGVRSCCARVPLLPVPVMDPSSACLGRMNMFDLSRPVAYETPDSCLPDSLSFVDGLGGFHSSSFVLPRDNANMMLNPNPPAWSEFSASYNSLDSPFLAVEVPLRSLNGNTMPSGPHNSLLMPIGAPPKPARRRNSDTDAGATTAPNGKKMFACIQVCLVVTITAKTVYLCRGVSGSVLQSVQPREQPASAHEDPHRRDAVSL